MTAAPADRFMAAEIRSPFVAQRISAKSLAVARARFAGPFSFCGAFLMRSLCN